MTKVSPQTFARGCKKRIQLGKTLQRICIDIEELILLIENVSN